MTHRWVLFGFGVVLSAAYWAGIGTFVLSALQVLKETRSLRAMGRYVLGKPLRDQ